MFHYKKFVKVYVLVSLVFLCWNVLYFISVLLKDENYTDNNQKKISQDQGENTFSI